MQINDILAVELDEDTTVFVKVTAVHEDYYETLEETPEGELYGELYRDSDNYYKVT